jgi:hypothetical protein
MLVLVFVPCRKWPEHHCVLPVVMTKSIVAVEACAAPATIGAESNVCHFSIFEVFLRNDLGDFGPPCRTHLSPIDPQVLRIGVLLKNEMPKFKRK